jgi:hypothetical protein
MTTLLFPRTRDHRYTCNLGGSVFRSHIASDPVLESKFYSQTDSNSFIEDVSSFKVWLRNAGKFVELLSVAVLCTGGQPIRGSELTSTLIINNDKGGLRNVFWTHQRIMISTYYSKNSNVSGDKSIARFLVKPLSYLLVIYQAIVRPFERLL